MGTYWYLPSNLNCTPFSWSHNKRTLLRPEPSNYQPWLTYALATRVTQWMAFWCAYKERVLAFAKKCGEYIRMENISGNRMLTGNWRINLIISEGRMDQKKDINTLFALLNHLKWFCILVLLQHKLLDESAAVYDELGKACFYLTFMKTISGLKRLIVNCH